MFITSMKPQLEVMYYPPKFLPPEFTFTYYFDAMNWLGGHGLKNSLIITTATTIVATTLGAMAGYSFARYKIGGFHLPFWILSIRMMPPVAAIPVIATTADLARTRRARLLNIISIVVLMIMIF